MVMTVRGSYLHSPSFYFVDLEEICSPEKRFTEKIPQIPAFGCSLSAETDTKILLCYLKIEGGHP